MKRGTEYYHAGAWTKSLSVLLAATLLIASFSCSRKARRDTGIGVTTMGIAIVVGGIVLANYHCEDPEDAPMAAGCFEGQPELGYSFAGIGLLAAAFGVYLLSTEPGTDDDQELEQWPEEMRLPQEKVVVYKDVLEIAPVELQNKKIQLQDKICFEFGKPDILPASHPVLDQLADQLKNTSTIKKVEIQSHIDARGSSDFNMKLTQQRAESVRQYLIEKGISPERMIAKGYGDTRPIHCEPHGCPEKCRRIEIWITE